MCIRIVLRVDHTFLQARSDLILPRTLGGRIVKPPHYKWRNWGPVRLCGPKSQVTNQENQDSIQNIFTPSILLILLHYVVKAINQTLVNHHFCLLLGAGSGAYARGPKLSPCSQQIVPWWERQNLFNKKGHMPINTYALQTVMLLGQVRRWAGKTIGLTPWQDLQKECEKSKTL